MNFFERQDLARRQSKRLTLLFVLAVAGVVAAVDLVLLVVTGAFGEGASAQGILGSLLVFSLLTLAVIACASLFRAASLRRGGAAVAQQMGATLVPENTSDFQLRRLRNVVEEIAIASGVPVPQIFVMEEEAAINAFAAGYSPADAAVTVTRGALDRLNRDELQGVIAHEFSHILNGDMRLNIRLIGLLFGIMVLALIGQKILRYGRFRGKDGAPVLMVALGLMVVGYVGLFFGRMIKAGVSRQREYLADASAVQFTRQARGIAGALKKIGGLDVGSKLANNEGEEVSHMLFGDGVGYSSLMATHPPLLLRIQALEPSFKPHDLVELTARWSMRPPVGLDEDAALGLVDAGAVALPQADAQVVVSPPAVAAQVGTPQSDDYRRAGAINDAIPEVLQRGARDVEEVQPLLFGLLLAAPGGVRDHQLYELKVRMGVRISQQALDYAERMADLHPILRLPLASLAFPALRRRPRPELQVFMDTMYPLVHADGQVSLFEYCLGRLLQTQVTWALDPSAYVRSGQRRLRQAQKEVVAVLTVIAQVGHGHPSDASRAYAAGLASIFPRLNAPYAPPPDIIAAMESAWPSLEMLDPAGKELLIEALVASISHDQQITVAEAELLRTICASLQCPLPPMLEASKALLS